MCDFLMKFTFEFHHVIVLSDRVQVWYTDVFMKHFSLEIVTRKWLSMQFFINLMSFGNKIFTK